MMRRSEREIKDPIEIDAILQAAPVCRIAMAAGGRPYVVPVNFAVSGHHLYFHCSRRGKKIDMLRDNPSVCFEADIPGDLRGADTACSWGMKYQSVIGFGEAYFIEDGGEKKKALGILMKKYTGGDSLSYNEAILDKVLVIGIRIESMSGKKSD